VPESKKRLTLYGALPIGGWSLVGVASALVVWGAIESPDNHIRGLVLGLGGALGLVIPPVRQAYRNYPFRRIQLDGDAAKVIPRPLLEAIIRRQNAAFVEFSWFDVACFSLGPVLLSAGIILDVLHSLQHH